MPDKVLTCQNCQKTFVYSEYEQSRDAKEAKKNRIFCPICQSIKMQESKRPARRTEGPAKPKTQVI